MNTINIQLTKLTTDNYTNTMYLKKDERSEVEKKRRHDKEHLDLNKELIDKKRKELEQLKIDLESLDAQFKGMADLQASIEEAKELKIKIELAKV